MRIGNIHISLTAFRKNGFKAFSKFMHEQGIYHNHSEIWEKYRMLADKK